MSPTQRWFGAAASNSRFSTFGAIGWACSLIVVERYRLRTRATSSASRISRMTRFRPTCSSSRSACTRGLPYVFRLWANEAAIFTFSRSSFWSWSDGPRFNHA